MRLRRSLLGSIVVVGGLSALTTGCGPETQPPPAPSVAPVTSTPMTITTTAPPSAAKPQPGRQPALPMLP